MRFLSFIVSNGVAPATKNVDVKRTLIIVGIALALYLLSDDWLCRHVLQAIE